MTLGIIGVISAMTVPSLMQNYQRQSYITQLHKVYNEVQQASLQYITERNAINLIEAGITSQAAIRDFSKTHFKIVKDCTKSGTECFSAENSLLNGTRRTSSFAFSSGYCFVTAGGASLCIDPPSLYNVTVNGTVSRYGNILIDSNGPKGPNIFGRDMFYAAFYPDGSIDVVGATPECKAKGICNEASLEAIRNSEFNKCKTSDRGCMGKILNDNWQMTY